MRLHPGLFLGSLLLFGSSVFALPGAFQRFDDTASPRLKKPEEYWKDLGLRTGALHPILQPTNCYQSERKFIACYTTLSAVAASAQAPRKRGQKLEAFRVVLPRARLASVRLPHRVLLESGDLLLVEVRPSDHEEKKSKDLTLKEVVAEYKADETALLSALGELYHQTPRRPVDFLSLLSLLEKNYVSQWPDLESSLTGEAINSYLSVIRDPHTSLEPKALFDDLTKPGASERTAFGIGVETRRIRGKIYIWNPYPESPALKAGLRANDELLEVNGQAVTEDDIGDDTDPEDVLAKTRGPENTVVRIKIRRGKQVMEFAIKRAKISVGKNVESSVIDQLGLRVGYIRLREFMEATSCEEVDNAVKALSAQGVKGLVLDLRNNGGGVLELAACIATIFIGPNQVLTLQKSLIPGIIEDDATLTRRTNRVVEETATGVFNQRFFQVAESSLPLVTLIDSLSASASEILASAFQLRGRSLVIGERSYGKGSAQRLLPYETVVQELSMLDPLGARELGLPAGEVQPAIPPAAQSGLYYKVTAQRFYPDEKFTNQVVGIHPEIEAYPVPDPTDDERIGWREEDVPYSLTAENPPIASRYPDLNKIRKCVKAAPAARYFRAHEHDARIPDYPVLVGQAALRCITDDTGW